MTLLQLPVRSDKDSMLMLQIKTRSLKVQYERRIKLRPLIIAMAIRQKSPMKVDTFDTRHASFLTFLSLWECVIKNSFDRLRFAQLLDSYTLTFLSISVETIRQIDWSVWYSVMFWGIHEYPIFSASWWSEVNIGNVNQFSEWGRLCTTVFKPKMKYHGLCISTQLTLFLRLHWILQ